MRYVHLLLLTGLVCSIASPAMADNSFTLVAKHSGKCARVDGRSQDNNANITQATCRGIYTNFRWLRVNAGKVFFYLKAKQSGKCAQVDNISQENSANISQYDCVNQSNVKWTLQPVSGEKGYYFIVNKASEKCMQVDNVSKEDGANISQYDCVDQDNVKWELDYGTPID
jgi:hypothetical protein